MSEKHRGAWIDFWGGVQERMVIKCYSKITTFLAELLSDTVQRLKQRAFLRSVWSARDFLSAWTRRQGAVLVALMFTSFLPYIDNMEGKLPPQNAQIRHFLR